MKYTFGSRSLIKTCQLMTYFTLSLRYLSNHNRQRKTVCILKTELCLQSFGKKGDHNYLSTKSKGEVLTCLCRN